MAEKIYTVTGMSCAACANAVEKALNKKENISASVNIATEKLNIEYDEKQYDFDKIKNIILQLSELGCNNIQFRFFDTLSINQLENLFMLFERTMLKNIEILIPYNTELTYENIHILCKNYPRLFNFHVYNAPTYKVHDLAGALISFSAKTINQIDSCGNINPKFFNQSLNQFTEAYNYNSCLYKQISIDINGEIKNCPSMSKSFGNINNISLQEVVDDNDFKSLWYIKKDNIEVCKDCEFRYMCIDCRCFIKDKCNIYSQPSKCKYNPYIGKWEGEKGYTPILKS